MTYLKLFGVAGFLSGFLAIRDALKVAWARGFGKGVRCVREFYMRLTLHEKLELFMFTDVYPGYQRQLAC